jgi:hypothetical protein
MKTKEALSFLGIGFIPERKNTLNGIWRWLKPLDFHRVFYKIDNSTGAYLGSCGLPVKNLIAASNVFNWLRLNSSVLKRECAVGFKI